MGFVQYALAEHGYDKIHSRIGAAPGLCCLPESAASTELCSLVVALLVFRCSGSNNLGRLHELTNVRL